MANHRDAFERIADALERMAPPATNAPDWLAYPAYVWSSTQTLCVEYIDALPLDRLIGIDQQKLALVDNLNRLADGAAAHDMLLWGSRGMGKSALVRASANAVQAKEPHRLALVQIAASELHNIARLLEELAEINRGFVLFIDDLGFGAETAQDNLALRSLLDGGVIARPPHIRLAVTSNRRAIVERDGKDNEKLHERDERDNALALADRFGLRLGFHPCDHETYLAIIASYLGPIGLEFEEEEALAWVIAQGNRSGRAAFQFSCEVAGRAGLAL